MNRRPQAPVAAAAGIRNPLQVVDDFRSSERVEIWQEKEFTLERSSSERLPENTVELGTSYTAVIIENKLILGKDIVGLDGRKGGSGSHFWLETIARPDTEDSVLNQAGAIRFNRDGSIDISGYHDKRVNLAAAERLAEYVRSISPDATIRITGDRLSSLPVE